ncbi:DUF998 domain-containing protein [Miltoncostaea marina]|uniref:DUF998 domain-containing protein n=1 Tax=Miltoncostaea marina TaxID=2843215 RepID=UPI001C3DB51F|nr:DUF998 domain-containing protein [Miltoncostaea marina]
MRRAVRRAGLAAGVLAPPVVVATLVPLTIASRGFLGEAGWSAVARRDVMWPSILAVGPHGWAMAVLFPLCGAAAVAFAAALRPLLPTRTARAATGCIALAGVALALLAFETDVGDDVDPTWHGVIHDLAYPPVPLASIAAAALLAAGLRGGAAWRGVARLSAAAAAAFAAAFALTAVGPIAQVARYALFGALLAWFEALALAAVARDRRSRRDPLAGA